MRLRYILPVLLLVLAAGVPARASLLITPIFDSSITGNVNATVIEDTILDAITFFDSTYSNPIDVTIEFQNMTSGLGDSQVGFVYNASYSAFYNGLVTNDANPAAIAGLTAADDGNNTLNPVNHTSTIELKSAEARAVGLSGAPLCNVTGSAGNLSCSGTPGGTGAIDGIVGLNTGITFPPNPQTGSDYDLLSTAEHEIDEILGLGSSLPNCSESSDCFSASAPNPSPEDLFTYTASGVLGSLSQNCSGAQRYFSYTGAANIINLNTTCNGGDWGDWAGGSTPHVQDAFATPGAVINYGTPELDAMSAIGYEITAPEPGTWGLMLTSLGAIVFVKRRMAAKA